jgi:glycosyltransferase involved in cell wall biosynthesis
MFYYIPLTGFAGCVGIPSNTADFYVFDYSRRVQVLKSGMDTEIFNPLAAKNTVSKFETSKEKTSMKMINTPRGKHDDDVDSIKALAGKGSENGPVLVYCGRLAKEKNIEFLIRSMANPLLKDATLLIVGGGPLRAGLETLAMNVVGANYVFSTDLDVNHINIGTRRRRLRSLD